MYKLTMRVIHERVCETRILWIDILRIVATWGVISIHGKSSYALEIGSVKWIESNIIGFAFTFCVPVFLMLSGMLTLKKKMSIKDNFIQRVLKVVRMVIISILLCAIAGSTMSLIKGEPVIDGVRSAVPHWGFGTSFLFVLAGCYLVSPFLSIVVEDTQLEKYFLVLAMIFCWVIPSIVDLDYVQNVMPTGLVTVAKWIDSAQIYIPVGSTMLFVLGHYLEGLSKKITKRSAFIWLVIGFVSWEVGSIFQSLYPESKSILTVLRYGRYYGGYVSPFITFYSATVFLFFATVVSDIKVEKRGCREFITHLGRHSVLIFLLHGIVISICRPRISVFWTESFLVETIVDVSIYFIICYMLSILLGRFSFIKTIIGK